jgi:hypothetical protein
MKFLPAAQSLRDVECGLVCGLVCGLMHELYEMSKRCKSASILLRIGAVEEIPEYLHPFQGVKAILEIIKINSCIIASFSRKVPISQEKPVYLQVLVLGLSIQAI